MAGKSTGYQSSPFAPPPQANQQSTSRKYEDHPLLAVVVTGRRRSTVGTFGSLCFVIPYLTLVVIPLVVIGFLASAENYVLDIPDVQPGCVLYSTVVQDTDDTLKVLLGQNGTCSFVISGEAIITILAIGLILAALIKTVRGEW